MVSFSLIAREVGTVERRSNKKKYTVSIKGTKPKRKEVIKNVIDNMYSVVAGSELSLIAC